MIFPISQLFAVLEFTSLPMLGWLAAAALPWLIHRWQRQRHQTTPWAAVELLLSAMRQRARRVRIQQWLLLAVRTAILVLVALAAAEPALRQWAVGAGSKAQTHRILVLDQSYSMGCEQSGSSRWQRAQSHARQSIESSDDGALTLIGWADQAENLLGRPTFDKSIALAALEDLQLSQSSADLSTVLRTIVAAIDRAEVEFPQIATHQVLFCTDLGRKAWSVDEGKRLLLESLANRANVTIVNVAEGRNDNLAITELQIDPAITLQQREATIAAKITCFGDRPAKNTNVELLIEGRRVDRQSVEFNVNGETTVQFGHRFVGKGAQTVQVVLVDNEDCLSSDDERWLIVDVRPMLRVACIAGQPRAADDLARALAPRNGLVENDGAIKPELFSVSRLGELDLSKYVAVMLSCVEEFSPREVATLTGYVRQGGALAMFLGPGTSLETNDELRRLLPVRVESVQPLGEYRFDPQEYRHRIVSPFRGQAQSGLLGVTVSQYRRLQLVEGRPTTEVVLKFDTGDPALVVDRFGLGRVAVSALPGSLVVRTAAGTPWSSFALSPSFLPVIRELVTYLVGDRWLQQRNLLVGESAVFPWPIGAKKASVRLPSGVRQTLSLTDTEDRGQKVFHETYERGVYQFNANAKECVRFAVNLDGRDSDLRPIELAMLPAMFTGNTVEGSLALSAVQGDFSFVRTLLASVLGLLLLEIGLAWQLGRGWG